MIIATLKDYNYGQYQSLEKFKDCFTVWGGVNLIQAMPVFWELLDRHALPQGRYKKTGLIWEIFPKCDWVGWLIPRQGPNSSKPPKPSQKSPSLTRISTFGFPKSLQKTWGGWVHTFGETFPNKNLKETVMIFLTSKI